MGHGAKYYPQSRRKAKGLRVFRGTHVDMSAQCRRHGDGDGIQSFAVEATSATETSIYLRGDLGAKSGTVDLDPGIGIKNANGSFIAKYSLSTTSPNWSPNWVGSIGVEGGSSGSTITDASSLYVLGSFQGTQDFDPSSGTMNLTSANQHRTSRTMDTRKSIRRRRFAIEMLESRRLLTAGELDLTFGIDRLYSLRCNRPKECVRNGVSLKSLLI